MLEIHKSSVDNFYIIAKSSNGRTLWHTENFTQKPSAWKNIHSTAKIFGGKIKVIDLSVQNPVKYQVTANSKKVIA